MADAEREENESVKNNEEEEMEGVAAEEEEEDSSENEDDEAERQIAELEQQVKDNPYLYDGHTLLINKLRTAGELERVQQARENMNAIFPLTAELWLEWIEDEKKVMSEDDRSHVTGLFDRAVKDYTSVSLWVEYIQFSIGGMAAEGGLEAVRAVCERAITATGLHVAEGWMVWEAYREYENAILMGLQPAPGATMSADQQKQVDAQMRRILAVFRRQLSVPLSNMEQTWPEFVDFAEEDEHKKVQPLYKKALSRLETLRPLEEALRVADNLTPFEDYIDHELTGGEPPRIQCIFERAIVKHCLIPRVWIRYTQYLDIELKIPDVVLSVYERAVRNCPWSSELWCGYGRAMERYGQLHLKTKDVFVRGLSGGFTSALEYLSVWNAHLDYLRRRINWTVDSEEEETKRGELWETFDQAVKHLTDNFGTEGDPECTLLRYKARLKAKLCSDMSSARDAWNEVMQAGHGNKAAMWLEFFNLERAYGDHKHARKILQRALNSANDLPETVVQAYIRFEREEGDTVDLYDAAMSRCEAQMARIEERRAKVAEKEAAEEAKKKAVRKEKKAAKKVPDKGQAGAGGQQAKTNYTKPNTQPSSQHGEVKVYVRGQPKKAEEPVRPYKRKAADQEESTEDTFKVPTGSPAKAPPPGFKAPPPGNKAPPPGFKGPKAPPPGYKGPKAPPPGYKGPSEESDQPPEKKAKVEDSPSENQPFVVDSSKESRTVFVSNIDFSLTEDDIRDVLGEVGEITDLRLIKTFTGKSKGFAYVEFNDELLVVEALKKDRTPIGGRPMFISKCNERTNNAATFKYATTLEKNKLFVRGLPFSSTQEDVEAEFAKHGKVKEVRLVTYRSGASKGLAYVEYVQESDASQAVLKMDGMAMGEHTISVDISNPPQRKAPASSFQPALGGGKRDAGGRGRASTQLSLVPRSLQRKPPSSTESATSAANGAGDKPAKMSNQDFRKMLLKQ